MVHAIIKSIDRIESRSTDFHRHDMDKWVNRYGLNSKANCEWLCWKLITELRRNVPRDKKLACLLFMNWWSCVSRCLYDSYRYYIQCMKFYIMYSQSFYIINYFCIKIVLFILFISWWISDVWCWNYISCRNCDVLSINDTSIQGMNVSRSIFSQVMIIRCVR